MAVSSVNFNANLAAKLDRLESGTALLERDARNGRALLSELGLASQVTHVRMLHWLTAQSRWLGGFVRAGRASLRALAAVDRGLRSPHLATAVRVTWSWLHEVAVIAAASCAALVPFVVAILIFATPE